MAFIKGIYSDIKQKHNPKMSKSFLSCLPFFLLYLLLNVLFVNVEVVTTEYAVRVS